MASEAQPEQKEKSAKLLKKTIRKHTDLEVYQRSFAAALRIHELTKSFPPEEKILFD